MGVYDYCIVCIMQLWDSMQNGFMQSFVLFQFLVYQMGNYFGVGFRNEGIVMCFQFFMQWFMVFDDVVMYYYNVFRNMWMCIYF